MNVEELVCEMERIKGWRLVDGCIGVEAAGNAPGFYMCPIVAVYWFRSGAQVWFTQSRLGLGMGVKERGQDHEGGGRSSGTRRWVEGKNDEGGGVGCWVKGICWTEVVIGEKNVMSESHVVRYSLHFPAQPRAKPSDD